MGVSTLVNCNPMCKAQSNTMFCWGIWPRRCVYRYWIRMMQMSLQMNSWKLCRSFWLMS